MKASIAKIGNLSVPVGFYFFLILDVAYEERINFYRGNEHKKKYEKVFRKRVRELFLDFNGCLDSELL